MTFMSISLKRLSKSHHKTMLPYRAEHPPWQLALPGVVSPPPADERHQPLLLGQRAARIQEKAILAINSQRK